MTIPGKYVPQPNIDAPIVDPKTGMATANGREILRAMGYLVALLNGELPTYANNAAAIAGGLQAGRWYVTSSGEVRIVV